METKKKKKKKTEKNKRKNKTNQKNSLLFSGIILESARLRYFALLLKLKDTETFRGISGFYSTSGYTAVIVSAHLVVVNSRFLLLVVLGTYSYALGQQPRWRVFSLLPANRVRQSIAHARSFKWKGHIPTYRWSKTTSRAACGPVELSCPVAPAGPVICMRCARPFRSTEIQTSSWT